MAGLDDYSKEELESALSLALAERDRYLELLQWQQNLLSNNIFPNDGEKHRLLLDGKTYDGPVVDWAHQVFTGLKDIIDNTISPKGDHRDS